MRAVTVYRLDDSSNFSYHTRHPVGSVLELRIYERVNNYKDLLRLARRLFTLDTADADHVLLVIAIVVVLIQVIQGRRGLKSFGPLPEAESARFAQSPTMRAPKAERTIGE